MRFEIVERDGLARAGIIELDGRIYPTPTICFVNTARYSAPEGQLRICRGDEGVGKGMTVGQSVFESDSSTGREGALITPGARGSPYCKEELKSELLVPGSVSSMLLDSRFFVESVSAVKKDERILQPLYCSVAGVPNRLAFLSYCGFDVFDSIPLIMSAESGIFLTASGALDYKRLKELPCSCPACSSGKRDKEALLSHNYSEALNELRLVRHAISEGRLRELVETRIRSDPWLVQNLRLMDLEQHELQERNFPIRGPPFHAGSKESLARPDVARWRRRLKERYKRPRGAVVLLLIPCSARR